MRIRRFTSMSPDSSNPGTPPPTAPRTNPPSARKAAQPVEKLSYRPPYSTSESSGDDHSSSSSTLYALRTKLNGSRINGVDPKKATASTTVDLSKMSKVEFANWSASTQPARTRNAAGSTVRTAVEAGDVEADEGDELDVLSWMERLKLEQSGPATASAPSMHFNAADAAANMLQNFMLDVAARDNMQIPPESMHVLQEALIAAAREGNCGESSATNVEDADRRTARAMAATFIQSAAAVGRTKRAVGSMAGSSSSASSTSNGAAGALADIPGLSPTTANEVWQEIQAYLQNLYASSGRTSGGPSTAMKNGVLSPPLGSAIAATLAAAQNSSGLPPVDVPVSGAAKKSQQTTVLQPVDSLVGVAKEPRPAEASKPATGPVSRLSKKKQKKKNKSTATVNEKCIHEVLERRKEILRLQAEKQREHDEAVAELRAHEARLLEAQRRRPKNPKMPFEILYSRPSEFAAVPTVKKKKTEMGEVATASGSGDEYVEGVMECMVPRPRQPPVPASWFNIVAPPRPPWRFGQGPYGPTYVLDDLAVTVHHDWIDDAMTTRGLRAYWAIWFTERLRCYDRCVIRDYEARKFLKIHCMKHRSGLLSFLTDGKSDAEWTVEDERNLENDEGHLEHRTFFLPCKHDYNWDETITFDRMKIYHRRFHALDILLPQMPGDFMFLILQIHRAIKMDEANEQEEIESYKRSLEAEKHENCSCVRCASEEQFMDAIRNPPPPIIPPFSSENRVELFLPTNYLLNQTLEKQYRMLMNQALLADGSVVIPRAPIVEEERNWARAKRAASVATARQTTSVDSTTTSNPVVPNNNNETKSATPPVEETTEVTEPLKPKPTNKKRKKRK